MTDRYCAICNGTGFYDAPQITGAYRTVKCDHQWQENALKYKLKLAKKKYEEAQVEYTYLIKCQKNMKEI